MKGKRLRVLELFYNEGISEKEVAARLGISSRWVESILSRTRARIRRIIEGRDNGKP